MLNKDGAMYVCEKCGRIWKESDADDNCYVCVKKCGGALLKTERRHGAGDLIDRLPFPVAYPWHMCASESIEPIKRVRNMVFTAYQALRTVALVLLADYLETPGDCPSLGKPLARMRMPHWAEWMTLAQTLAKFLAGRNNRFQPAGTPLFKDLALSWLNLGKAWKHSPLSAQFAPNPGAGSSMEIFWDLRNRMAHNQGVLGEDGEEREILDSCLPVLEHMLDALFSDVSLTLVRLPMAGAGGAESCDRMLDDPLCGEIDLMRLAGPHPDFLFELEKTALDDSLREALAASSIAAVAKGETLPVYPFFLVLDREADLVSGMIEPVTMVDSFSEKKVAHLGVRRNGAIPGLGAVVTRRLAEKKHELGLTRDESSPWLMVEWARDNARATLDNLTMTKYFPQCYVPRLADRLLAQTAGTYTGPVVVAGEAGSGKSSLLCAMVGSLIRTSESDEDAGERFRLHEKKVRGRLKSDERAMDAFFSLKGAGDVVVFLSGPKAVVPDAEEPMERAFCRALLNACGVMPSEFHTAESFMKRIDVSKTAPENSPARDEIQERKVWIVLDAVNESDRFRDLAAVLDRFAERTRQYTWLRLVVSMRAGALDSLQTFHKAKLAHGLGPFTDENVYAVFVNEYENGPREEPRLNLPRFTGEEARAAYEIRREKLPERATRTPYEFLPPEVAALLASPLYLHVFNETWKGVEADLTLASSESALFEAYLDSLERDLPGMGDVLEVIGDDLYREEAPVWTEELAEAYTEHWRKKMHLDSIMNVCTLSPVEMLVSASLLMRPAEDESGYQFSHQRICEQVLKRRMLKDWERADKTEESAAAVFSPWMEKAERFDWIANAAADIFGGWAGKPESRFLPVLAGVDVEAGDAFETVFKSVVMEQCRAGTPDDSMGEFLDTGFSNDRCFRPLLFALAESYELATTTAKTMGIFQVLKLAVPAHERRAGRDPENTDFQRDLSVSYNNVGNIYKSLGEGQKALEFFEKDLQVMLRLVESEPHRTDFQRDLSVSYNNVGNIYKSLGEGQKALEFFEKSLQVMRRLVESEPHRTDFQRELSVSYNNVGNIYTDLGEGQKALEFFEKSLQVMRRLVESEPHRTDFQRDLSVSYNNVGNIYTDLGEGQKALEFFEKSLQVMLRLVESEPHRTDFQRDLSVSYNNVGNIYTDLGEGQKALEFFEKSLQVRLRLVESEPHRTDFQRDLSVSYNNVGNIYTDLGEGQKALEFFEKDLQVMLRLVESEPHRTDFQRDLSVSYNNVGNIYKSLGEGQKALEFFEKSLQVRLRLVESEPHRTDFQRDLSVSYNNVGNIYTDLGEGQKALEFFEKSLQVMLRLVESEPHRTDFQIDYAISHWNMYLLCEKEDERYWLEKVLGILIPLKEKGKTHFQLEQLLGMVQEALAGLGG